MILLLVSDSVFKVVHSLPCTAHVFPCPDTGLTYIHRAGWDGAMQMAVKPDQLAAGGLKAHQDSACLSPDRGFHALHHILAIHLLFLFHNNLTPRSWQVFYQTKRKKRLLCLFQPFSAFFCSMFFLAEKNLSNFKNSSLHWAAVLHHWWMHFSKIQFPPIQTCCISFCI